MYKDFFPIYKITRNVIEIPFEVNMRLQYDLSQSIKALSYDYIRVHPILLPRGTS
jgi:hypothetical protein